MGQEQSAPAPRRATNKLSKPRTNSSGNLISKIPGPPPSRQNSQSNNGSPAKSRNSLLLPDTIVGEVEEKKEGKSRKRMSLFRSKSSRAQAKLKTLEVDTGVEREFVDPSPVDRPVPVRRNSRANSVTFEDQEPDESLRPPNRSRMTLQHFPYQHHARLSLVAEAQSPEPEKSDSKRLSRYEEEEVEPQASLPRTMSEPALYVPIRRRSLLQHGVATRTSLFSQDDSRQSLPSQVQAQSDDFQDYYYNPTKPTSSPLSDIAALGRQRGNGSPGPRVATPTDMGYGHIGVFKLGSLRITNGSASPVPSDGRPTTAGIEDDYLEVVGRKSGESLHRNVLSQSLAHPELIRAERVASSESPLRQTHEVEMAPLTIDTQLPIPDPSLGLFKFTSKHSPNKSLDLANEYIQDLALSPFSFEVSPAGSPTLEATSKHMAVDDDLFEPEPNSPNPGISEHAPSSFDSGYGTGESMKSSSGSREPSMKPLAKADSGYSSNVSLRSLKKDVAPIVPAKEAPPTPPKEAGSRIPSSTYSISSQASDVTLRAQRSLPALPTQDYIPPPPFREASTVPPKHATVFQPAPQASERNWEPRMRTSGNINQTYVRQQSLPSIPKALREPPIFREKSSSSGDSMSSNGSKLRSNKMHKQRPQSYQPAPVFTIQAVGSEALSIPPVPAETSRKLEQRVDGFPVACFPNTVAGTTGLRKSSSKETLGTIFSVGSAEAREELSFARLQSALPPVPVYASIPENAPTSPEQKPDFNRRNTYQPTSSAQITPRKSFDGRRSIQATPKKSLEQQQEDFEAHVTSFDGISSSLGSSPYSIATQPQSPNTRAKSLTSQFEANAAAQFQRSRDVSAASTMLRDKQSYDSIAAGNPFSSSPNTAPHSRKSSREYPPQAHSNASVKRPFAFVPTPPVVPTLQSLLAEERERERRSPPVSMRTRKSLPPPARASPQPPPQQTETDEWAKPANFWADRRKSAGETLQTKKSMEMSRPSSARPSVEQVRPTPQTLRGYGSFDHVQRAGWENDHANTSYSLAYSDPSASAPAPQAEEGEYYDQDDDSLLAPHIPERNHARSNSTEDMLILDRYTGGLGYGFEDRGLVGSAGTRNIGSGVLSGQWAGRKGEWGAREWGVDLSDVPIFLQQRFNIDH
ncbi:hypothetical protein LCER1_G002504 [Lachnellula cervina]|uniref:Proteophosphoglycan ppg4 n=1 Tax=Lachnellula cervina TaxID=1316786 RepID=A0A7D8URF2_9HELO|nr:hypothetical protein LCER1_G002504 [Lachnellula cervina]